MPKTRAPYLDHSKINALFPLIELGVTGDVVWKGDKSDPYNSARFERVIVKGHEDRDLWVSTHVDDAGELTGDWDAIDEAEARSLGLI